MGTVTRIRDNLINFVTGLGTIKDPTTSSMHNLVLLDRGTLDVTYRSNWLAKRIVNAPAEDATREWRTWQAANKQIEALEDAEKEFDLQRKTRQTLMRSRLYGGAALVLGVDQGNPEDELDIAKVGKGDLKFIVSVSMHDLAPGPVVWDVMSPWYARPEYYTVASRIQNLDNLSTVVRIHPSRVITFVGSEIPDPTISPMGPEWGDSVLIDCDEVIKDFGMVVGGLANMVNDAKMDVIKIPDFSKNIATQEYANRLFSRFTMANQAKSSINSLLLDSEEEWNRITTSFSALPQLLHEFLTVTSGAAGIPVSRLMGQAPGQGLGSSTSGGEQDMRNYYDTITAMQRTMIGPTLEPLDNILMAHALGKVDPVIFYEWAPLYTPDPAQLADIALKKAQITAQDVSMALINPDALRRARINQLVEDGTYPGLEDAIEEFGEEPPEPEVDPNYDPNAPKPDDQGGGNGGGGGGKAPQIEITHKVAAQDYNPNRWPAGSPESRGGEFAPREGGPKSVTFVSPNIEEGLDISKATAGMQSLRQQKLMEVSDQIDEALGLKSNSTPVLGAWADGAEHSVMTEYKSPDFKTVVAAAAMKAYLADQKAVLVFQKNNKASGFLYNFKAKGSLEQISQNLVEDGVAFHTLVPVTSANGRTTGADVFVYDEDGSVADAAIKGAGRYGSKVEYTRGEGRFVGTSKQDGTDAEQRADARASYAREIEGSGSDGVKQVWRDVGPASGKDALAFGDLTASQRALSVSEILSDKTPSLKARSRNVEDIAKDLNERAKPVIKAAGFKSGKITESTPKGDALIAGTMADEVQSAMQRSGRSSTGWYSDKVSKAVELAALTHNELTQDPNAAMAYKLGMAVTSQGETVPSNVRLTEQVYEQFKQTGRFPTNIEAENKKAINGNFKKLNKLIDDNDGDLDKVREFLDKEFTVGELKAQGYKVQGENVDTKVYGSAILGAKIGQGFYQNLNGNFKPMTFDLWWMRGWGRLTGTLVGVPKETLAKQKDRLVKALEADNIKVPRTEAGLTNVANDIIARHEIDYVQNRDLYNSKERSKSELTFAAERYRVGKMGIKEQPSSGSERAWMRSVGSKVLEILKSKGIDMTPADLQATWWYPEKTLYSKLGGRDSERINVDYASVLADLARSRGKSEADIRRILGT